MGWRDPSMPPAMGLSHAFIGDPQENDMGAQLVTKTVDFFTNSFGHLFRVIYSHEPGYLSCKYQ